MTYVSLSDALVTIQAELDWIELDVEKVMNDRPEFVDVGQYLLDRLGRLRMSIEVTPEFKAARGRGITHRRRDFDEGDWVVNTATGRMGVVVRVNGSDRNMAGCPMTTVRYNDGEHGSTYADVLA